MSIKEVHDWIRFILDEAEVGFVSPERIDDACHRRQMGLFASFYDNSRQTNFLHAGLSPFLVLWDFTAANFTGGAGRLVTPADFEYEWAMYHVYTDGATTRTRKVDFLRSSELPGALESVVKPLTVHYPGVVRVGKDLQWYPKQSFTGVLHYLKTPVKPVYAYDMDGRNPVYKETGSVDMLWAEPYMNLVMLGALEFLGVNLNDPKIVQYTMQKQLQPGSNPDKP